LRNKTSSVLIEIVRPRSRTFFLPTSRDVGQVSNGHANEMATEMRGRAEFAFTVRARRCENATPTPQIDD